MHRAFLCSFAVFTSAFTANPHRIAAEEWHTPVPTPPPAVIQAATPTDDVDNPRFEGCIRETLSILSRLSGKVSSSTTTSLAEQTSAVATHDSVEAQVIAIGGVELLLAITQELKQPDSRGHAELFYSFYRGWFGLDWPTPQHIAAYNDYLRTPGLAMSPTLKNNILSFNALVYNYLNTHIDYNPQSDTYGHVKPRTPKTGTIIGITVGCTLAALAAGLGGYWWARSQSKKERHSEAVDALWSYWQSQKGQKDLAKQTARADEHWKKSSLAKALATWVEKKQNAQREQVNTSPLASSALSTVQEDSHSDNANDDYDTESGSEEKDAADEETPTSPLVTAANREETRSSKLATPPNTPVSGQRSHEQAAEASPHADDSQNPPPPSREQAAADLAEAQRVPLPASPSSSVTAAATQTTPASSPPAANTPQSPPIPPQRSWSLRNQPRRGRTMARRADNPPKQTKKLPAHSPIASPTHPQRN